MPTTSSVPVEIVSEEDMALIEAAFSSARTLLHSPPTLTFHSAVTHVVPPLVTVSSAGRNTTRQVTHSTSTLPQPVDIEDAGRLQPSKSRFEQFRRRGTLSVTDLTASEWCEKQMEFSLIHGKPERTEAMKVGSERHVQLEQEVIKRVDITITSREDSWAVRFLNFIAGVHQLLAEGITRELMVVGILQGTWVIGVIDEIRLPMTGPVINPLLVDTKTRTRASLPSEAQKRNARFQLMCYKFLWDNAIDEIFPADKFFKHFDLDPNCSLSEEVKMFSSTLGFCHKRLVDVVTQFVDVCKILPRSEEKLLLRYELQRDHSELGEFKFPHDAELFSTQVQKSFEFWSGTRESTYVSREERWKCNFCKFADRCPGFIKTNS